MTNNYGLSFISDEDLFFHVKETIEAIPIGKATITGLRSSATFHQSLLKSIANNKKCRSIGFDMIRQQKRIFAEVKNKCPSMNAKSARDIYIQMQHEILTDRSTTCYLVEMLAKPQQDKLWEITVDGQKLFHANLRRISLDKFYELVTNVSCALKQLYQILPLVLGDVLTRYPIANFAVSCHK